jgi:hypothetical protein
MIMTRSIVTGRSLRKGAFGVKCSEPNVCDATLVSVLVYSPDGLLQSVTIIQNVITTPTD